MDQITINQQRERLQQQLAELEQQQREAEALRQVREVEARQRRDQAISDHQAAEKEHAADLTAMTKTLAGARKDLATRVDAAVAALLAVWDSATAYNTLLDESAEQLIAAGLPARWEENGLAERFATGGHTRSAFGGPRVALAGRNWVPVNPRQMLAFVVALTESGRVPGRETPKFQPVSDVIGDLVKPLKTVPAPPQPRPQLVSMKDLYGPSMT